MTSYHDSFTASTTMNKLASSSTSPILVLKRSVSSSPYGRTHVWRRRAPKLPNPVVPHFPQRVTLADGSTFVHWTTSPRSAIRLTRDNTNNPLWNPWVEAQGLSADSTDESASGRMGRFGRKFEDMGGVGFEVDMDVLQGEAEKAR